MKKEEITNQLKKAGHSDIRITEIHEEAKQSSNPQFIYQYWGIKINNDTNPLFESTEQTFKRIREDERDEDPRYDDVED